MSKNMTAIARKRKRLTGTRVTSISGLAKFTGPAAFGKMWGGWLKHAWHQMDTSGFVKLCPQTRDILYSRFTSTRVKYEPGSRPVLESIVDHEITLAGWKKKPTSRQIAERLAEWTYWEVYRRGEINRLGKWAQCVIDGGTEEDILVFDGRTDSYCCSRVLALLLQVKKIPARLGFLFGKKDFDGRVGVEVYLAGSWGFFDVNANVHCLTREGKIASLWEIATDPYCIQKGMQGVPNSRVNPADFDAFDQLAIANYST